MKFRKKCHYWYVRYEALREQRADLSSTVRRTAADEEGRCITERAVKIGQQNFATNSEKTETLVCSKLHAQKP